MADEKLDTVEILHMLGNQIRKAIVASLVSRGEALKFSELMQASGLNPSFDTGYFEYHLSELIKRRIVVKKNGCYLLSEYGLKLGKILDMVQQESSFMKRKQENKGEEKLDEENRNDFWEKHWLTSIMRGWSRAEPTVESICKILAKNGISMGNVLDLCCGTGRLPIWMAKKGFNAVGLDSSPLYLEKAAEKAKEHGVESRVEFIIGDVRDVDKVVIPESPFDCVLTFWNSIGLWGDKADEMIFTKVKKMTRKGGILIIGECDHLGHLMLNLDERRVLEYENAIIIEEAKMDYITNMFTAVFRYYEKEGDSLKYFDSWNYQTKIYSVCELSSLLGRAGWTVVDVYEDIETLKPFTNGAIFKGNRSMNIVAKAM
jgi:ubiquinone/menaquinone biosynthesis C-methylase UbiE